MWPVCGRAGGLHGGGSFSAVTGPIPVKFRPNGAYIRPAERTCGWWGAHHRSYVGVVVFAHKNAFVHGGQIGAGKHHRVSGFWYQHALALAGGGVNSRIYQRGETEWKSEAKCLRTCVK